MLHIKKRTENLIKYDNKQIVNISTKNQFLNHRIYKQDYQNLQILIYLIRFVKLRKLQKVTFIKRLTKPLMETSKNIMVLVYSPNYTYTDTQTDTRLKIHTPHTQYDNFYKKPFNTELYCNLGIIKRQRTCASICECVCSRQRMYRKNNHEIHTCHIQDSVPGTVFPPAINCIEKNTKSYK